MTPEQRLLRHLEQQGRDAWSDYRNGHTVVQGNTEEFGHGYALAMRHVMEQITNFFQEQEQR